MFILKCGRKQGRVAKVPNYIPGEILFDILARSPVKSPLRFRCVGKSWNTLITSQGFKHAHQEANQERNSDESGSDNYLLFRYRYGSSYLSIATLFNAGTFSELFDIELPGGHRTRPGFYVFGSCKGLLCVSGDDGNTNLTDSLYLWNPSIRKSKKLPEYCILGEKINGCNWFGFGFHREENDYRAVRVVQFFDGNNMEFEAEVYSLGLDSWRRISAVPPLASKLLLWSKSTYLNGVVYWIVREFGPRPYICILSFDLESEVFGTLPSTLMDEWSFSSMSIRVFENRLSVFKHYIDEQNMYSWESIWALERDTWKMIRAIRLPKGGRIAWPVGFTTDGGVYFTSHNEDSDRGVLFLHDPVSDQSKRIQARWIEGIHHSYVYSYMESLALLN